MSGLYDKLNAPGELSTHDRTLARYKATPICLRCYIPLWAHNTIT